MLFERLTIGSLTVENRLMRSATWEGMAGGIRCVDLYPEPRPDVR